MPKFGSELAQRTGTGRTGPTVLVQSGSGSGNLAYSSVLGSENPGGTRTEFEPVRTELSVLKIWYVLVQN
jgi:hypothetical protein